MPQQGSLVAWTWACTRPYRGRIALLVGIAATEITLGLLTPWPLKLLIDNVLGNEPMPPTIAAIAHVLTGDSKAELLFVVVIGGLLLQLASQVVSTINTQVQVDTGQRMVYTLRARLLAHLQALPLRHHIVTRTADSVYRLEADAYCVNDLVMGGVFPLVTSVLKLGRDVRHPGAARPVAGAAVAGGGPVPVRRASATTRSGWSTAPSG